jgi:hypothetical protein
MLPVSEPGAARPAAVVAKVWARPGSPWFVAMTGSSQPCIGNNPSRRIDQVVRISPKEWKALKHDTPRGIPVTAIEGEPSSTSMTAPHSAFHAIGSVIITLLSDNPVAACSPRQGRTWEA